MYVLYALLTWQWSSLRWDLAFAALMFVLLLGTYIAGWMGGGDVKILAVAFLWTGYLGALPFAILLALFSSIHAGLAKLGWVASQTMTTGHRRIPFAPSVAGALIGVFILRGMHLV
jgi:prepilin peptidase CpaA